MSTYEEFQASATQEDQWSSEFYRVAGEFPQKLAAAIEDYLGCRASDLEIVSLDQGSHWHPWPGQLSRADFDEDGLFNVSIAITIRLKGPRISQTKIYPEFSFRPNSQGVAAYVMRRTQDEGLRRGPESLITDDNASFNSLLDQIAALIRDTLAHNPFVSSPSRRPIGFDIRRTAEPL